MGAVGTVPSAFTALNDVLLITPPCVCMQAAYRRPSPPLQRDQQPSSSPEPQQPADAVVHVRVARQDAEEAASGAAAAAAAAAGAAGAAPRAPSSKRPPPPSLGDGKRQKLAGVGDLGHDDDANTQYRCTVWRCECCEQAVRHVRLDILWRASAAGKAKLLAHAPHPPWHHTLPFLQRRTLPRRQLAGAHQA